MTTTHRTEHATQLIQQLRKGLLDTQDALTKIIQGKEWEPLGYATFRELWEDRLTDIELTGIMRISVIYAMFNDGSTDVEVATTIKGVGEPTAKSLRHAHIKGLTPKQAHLHAMRTNVRSHPRKLPTKRNGVYLDGFTDKEIKRWNELAKDRGIDRNDMLRTTLRQAMNAQVAGHVTH